MESESSEIHGNRSDCDCDCWKLCCRPRAGHLNPLFSNILVKPQLFTVSIDKSFLGLFLITTKPMFVSVSGFQEFSLWLMEFFLCLRLGWKKAVWKTRVKAKLPSLKNVIQIRDKAEEDTLPYWFQITTHTHTHTWGFELASSPAKFTDSDAGDFSVFSLQRWSCVDCNQSPFSCKPSQVFFFFFLSEV